MKNHFAEYTISNCGTYCLSADSSNTTATGEVTNDRYTIGLAELKKYFGK